MSQRKTAAAIHDISGYGKCSLTVVLPILSAAGIETSVIPTALLSTHTGTCFQGYYSRDLTDDMRSIIDHWKELELSFGAIYSGYLGSFEQIDIVRNFIENFKDKDTVVLVDPVLGDNGSLYPLCTSDMVDGMSELCSLADIIVPNVTEAALLTEMEYKNSIHSVEYIEKLVNSLTKKFNADVVVTGISVEDKKLGAAAKSRNSEKISFFSNNKVEGMFHGTGDIFASVLLCGIMCGKDLDFSTRLAVNFVAKCTEATAKTRNDEKSGVMFEKELPSFLKELDLL